MTDGLPTQMGSSSTGWMDQMDGMLSVWSGP
jgi:hypothetical protein